MTIKEITAKTGAELQELLRETQKKLQDLRLAISESKMTQLAQYRMVRKDIARIKTVLKQKNPKL